MAGKKTTYSSTDGRITGKQVSQTYSDGSSETTNYKATGGEIRRTILGPDYTATSTTYRDKDGNTRTKTYKS